MNVTQTALAIDGVKSASFRRDQVTGRWTGVVFHRCGTEFDVRQTATGWNVNDDDGRNFRSVSLARAIRKATRA